MFGRDHSTTPKQQSAPGGNASQNPKVQFDDIHVMPDRFIDPEAKKTRRGKSNKMLLAVIVVTLLFGGGAAAAVYFLASTADENSNTANVANFQLNLNTGNTNTVSNANSAQNANANSNTNAVTNSNANSNRNLNSNGNTNSFVINLNGNTNANANSNTNAVTNSNANSNANSNTNTSGTRTEPLPSTLDTDEDGLTDVEEQLYGTEASQPDTDGDGFIDGKRVNSASEIVGEVYLGYNPRGIGRLDTTGLVRTFTNDQFRYSILYPTQWVASAADQAARTVQFLPTNPTGETFQVIVEDNPTKLSARNYFISTHPGVTPVDIEGTINGLVGIISPNGEDVYLAKDDKMYIIHYSVSQLNALNFRTTFEMMYQSFRLTSTSS